MGYGFGGRRLISPPYLGLRAQASHIVFEQAPGVPRGGLLGGLLVGSETISWGGGLQMSAQVSSWELFGGLWGLSREVRGASLERFRASWAVWEAVRTK